MESPLGKENALLDSKEVPSVKKLDLESFPCGERTELRVVLCEDSFGQPFSIPVIVIRGQSPGPVLGITAAVHGNELNGIKVIHRLAAKINPEKLRGSVVAVPVVNIPGFIRNQREFSDGSDLNRIMPGKEWGNRSQQYSYAVLQNIISAFDYLVDLHTASFGRVNSLYIRADLGHSQTRKLAELQNGEILLHNCGADGTLRSAAAKLGIPALTVEVGNPQLFQDEMIKCSVSGLQNILSHLEMVDHTISIDSEPTICSRSYWIYTSSGGILDVTVSLREIVEEGQIIARVTDIYGRTLSVYKAPERGVVIGKSTNPVNSSGSRIIHLGIIGEDFTVCPIYGSE
jgi:uncharacterized protein